MCEYVSRFGRIVPGVLLLLLLAWQAAVPAAEPAQGMAPEFTLPTDRGEISLAQLRGQVVYVDFWASWCGPCRMSFPWMNDMHARYGQQGLAIVAVNLDTERKLSAKFLEKYPASFLVAYDPPGKVAEAYRVAGMPTSYLIDRQGRLHATHQGFREEDMARLEAEIRALLTKD
jgi:thiol-disulfide isomerase/thioredoxin